MMFSCFKFLLKRCLHQGLLVCHTVYHSRRNPQFTPDAAPLLQYSVQLFTLDQFTLYCVI